MLGDPFRRDPLHKGKRVDCGEQTDDEEYSDPARVFTKIAEHATWFVKNAHYFLEQRKWLFLLRDQRQANKAKSKDEQAHETERSRGGPASGDPVCEPANQNDEPQHKYTNGDGPQVSGARRFRFCGWSWGWRRRLESWFGQSAHRCPSVFFRFVQKVACLIRPDGRESFTPPAALRTIRAREYMRPCGRATLREARGRYGRSLRSRSGNECGTGSRKAG